MTDQFRRGLSERNVVASFALALGYNSDTLHALYGAAPPFSQKCTERPLGCTFCFYITTLLPLGTLIPCQPDPTRPWALQTELTYIQIYPGESEAAGRGHKANTIEN